MSQVAETICSNCHSTMPAELRFCRNCGFRLTGNTGGYTGSQHIAVTDSAALPKKKRRISGMSWIFVGLLVFFVGAAAFTALLAPLHKTANIVQRAAVVKSYIGVDEFNNSDQGVMFEAVATPNGPADQAGLVGGDVILTFDGQPVQNEDQMDDLMTKTPVGKGGELQLTDAMRLLLKQEKMYAYVYEGKRHDAGDKLGFLKATVEFALKRDDLGGPLKEYLRTLKLD